MKKMIRGAVQKKIVSTSDAKVTNRVEANGRLASTKGRNKFRVMCEDFSH